MLKIPKYIRRVPTFEVQNGGGDSSKGIISVYHGKLMIEACMESAVRAERQGT